MTSDTVIGSGERIDSIITSLNSYSPIVWLFLAGSLYVASKELMQYNKNNVRGKKSVHDNLDEKAFDTAVMPLMIQLDHQVAGYARDDYEQALSENGEEFNDPIVKYENVRKEALQSIDVSALSQALKLSDSLVEAAHISKSKDRYDNLYAAAKSLLKHIVNVLRVNLLVGAILIASTNGFPESTISRYVFLVWIFLCMAFGALTVLYVQNRVKVDDYGDKQ